jgi:hypothetical protein
MKTEKELTLTADVEKLLSINNLSIVKKPWSKTKNLIIDGINYLIPFCAIVYTLMAWSIFEYYIYFSNIVVIILLLLALFTYLYPKYSKEFDDQGREKKKLKFSMASTTGYWNTFYAKGITYTTVLKVISLQSVVICIPHRFLLFWCYGNALCYLSNSFSAISICIRTLYR